MGDVVRVTRDGPVAIVTVDNPPVNAVGVDVRKGLWDAVPALDVDDAVRAVVLVCAGRTFIAGADIREFDGGAMEPWLPDLVERIHAAEKPWIAALHGTALGGGLETALGCHYRLAVASARVGLPEVTLGIVPGAGGTQRLPRIVGPEAAVEMVCGGRPIGAERAVELGLVDALVEDLDAAPRAFARDVMEREVPRLDAAPGRNALSDDAWQALRDGVEAKARGQIAPVRAFDVVKRAFEIPLDEGMKAERALFLALKETDQSKALRHAFFAERAVTKPRRLEGAEPRPINKLCVVGGGLMGSGIATAALSSGLPVVLIEQDAEAMAGGVERIEANLEAAVGRGLMSEERMRQCVSDLSAATEYKAAGDCDIAIEAVFEDPEVKRGVFTHLAKCLPAEAVLASNTSYLDPASFTADVPEPARILGLHFFSPAHIMKLVEVVHTDATAPDVIATGFALARRLRKTGVLSGVCEGFIGNRILGAYLRAAGYLLEDGCLPQDVDGAMRAFGMAMGPFEMSDMAGLQIGYATRKRLAATRDPDERYSRIGDLIVELGRTGQRSGQGYYRYDGGRTPIPDPEIETLIVEESTRLGISRREISAEAIQARLHAVQVNEAAKILEEGIAERPLDIDVVKLLGYGYPRWRGGPMFWADTIGPAKVLAEMQAAAAADPGTWTVAPLLEKLVAEDRGFATLNR
ncbi:MAG: 3-hydroxyacyl-CoA dehydrogenase NAD-binding domain-containing protein [Pseudomonadota bacterium]